MTAKKQGPIKAYKNLGFLNSKDARPIRILSEFIEPLSRFKYYGIRDIIVFFGSARIKSPTDARKQLAHTRLKIKKSKRLNTRLREELRQGEIGVEMSRYYEDAVELARLLTKWSMRLKEKNRFVVCTGGGPGIMEAANR